MDEKDRSYKIPDFPFVGGPYDGGAFIGNPEFYPQPYFYESTNDDGFSFYYEYVKELGSLMFRGFTNYYETDKYNN